MVANSADWKVVEWADGWAAMWVVAKVDRLAASSVVEKVDLSVVEKVDLSVDEMVAEWAVKRAAHLVVQWVRHSVDWRDS